MGGMTSDDDLAKTREMQASITEAFGLESALYKLAHPEPVTLVKFLEDRLRDDECYALNAFKDYGEHSGDTVNGPEWSEIWSGTVQCGPQGEHIATFDSGLSRHIVQHDPARALRQVEAGRAILKAHPLDTEYDHVAACRACQWDVDCGAPRDDLEPSDCPCPTLRNLAWTWHTEQGWDMAWCPHHEEDHAEVDHAGPFRAFKRTCRHCQADLGKLLKPRLDGD
jgi:hypothetical protein